MENAIWPLFDLEITTPRLTLRPPNDDELGQLVALITKGIHDPQQMPFSEPWTRGESPDRERAALQYHWGTRAALKPEQWDVNFGVWFDGRLVGAQGLMASGFSTLREVHTGSWLIQEVQGRHIGKEMRAAVLWLAFDTLGALTATTEAYHWNEPSIGVTRSLGYADNGERVANNEGTRAVMKQFRMTREQWLRNARDSVAVSVAGAEKCLVMLGAKKPSR